MVALLALVRTGTRFLIACAIGNGTILGPFQVDLFNKCNDGLILVCFVCNAKVLGRGLVQVSLLFVG